MIEKLKEEEIGSLVERFSKLILERLEKSSMKEETKILLRRQIQNLKVQIYALLGAIILNK